MTKRQDTGCKLYSSCLECPLLKCVFDEPGSGIAGARRKNRNEEIWQRFNGGESIADLAKAFGVSERTIQRVVVRYKRG